VSDDEAIVAKGINYFFGDGDGRRQILSDINLEIRIGEIVILTGPSGSGKTTLLTLSGALRTLHDGSLRVLGQELCGARNSELVAVRRKIGYIFQAHNLLNSLTALENVEMSLIRNKSMGQSERHRSALQALEAVGLEERATNFPDQLSGGQRQRVAIARALVASPRLILADEPTASLDKKSGREAIEIIRRLAKSGKCSVLLVTHDNRILDVADRIVHLEDGRMQQAGKSVVDSAQQLMTMLQKGGSAQDVADYVHGLSIEQFIETFDKMTFDFQRSLSLLELMSAESFEATFDQVIESLTFKIGQILSADRATLFLVDPGANELWSKVAQANDRALTIRIPLTSGIAGAVARSGEMVNVADAANHPEFNGSVDETIGYKTNCALCAPIRDSNARIFGVIELINKSVGVFVKEDELQLSKFAESISPILETWWHLSASKMRAPKAVLAGGDA
jgi:putative ABC transport system ATP-binding protein